MNYLTSLDVSKNTALTELHCNGNLLESLDVSKNTALTELHCNGNQLTSLDVSENTALTYLYCDENQLTSLDISKNTDLYILSGDNQHRTVQLPYTASGWQLDMAKLVGADNLAKVKFDSDVPQMSAEGMIIFPMEALPEEISYVLDFGMSDWGDELTLGITLKLEKGSEQAETDPSQPETDPPQTEKDPEQTEKNPPQTEKAPQQTEANPPQTEKQPDQSETKAEHTVHTFGAYTVTKEPTVLAEGTETRSCTVCGATESRAVAKLTPTMELNATSIKLKTKQSTSKIKVSGLADGDAVASWTSSNPKIVTVDGKGKIKAKAKKGKATVTVTLESGFSRDIQVTVQKNQVACTKLTLNKKSVMLKKGKSFTLKATVNPITCIQKVKYSTSDSSVATVSGKGVIKAKKKGSAMITVKVGKKKVKCKVKVK